MGIEVASSFTRKAAVPLDDLTVVADLTARDAIEAGVRYEGMVVYVVSEGANYQLVGGTDNVNWEDFGSAGGGGSTFNLEARDISASPILKVNGLMDTWVFSANTEDENLWGKFVLPENYKPGKDIKLNCGKIFVDSADTSKFIMIRFVVYLFKDGSVPLSLGAASATDVYDLSIQVPGVANTMINVEQTISSAGEIDGVPLAPKDLILTCISVGRSVETDLFQGEVNLIKETLSPRVG